MITRLYRKSERPFEIRQPVVGVLGNLDGVHLGHQELLKAAKDARNKLLSEQGQESGGSIVAISFYPHPDIVLGKAKQRIVLTTFRQKLEALRRFGVDTLYLIRFTKQLAGQSAREFIEGELFGRLNLQHLVVGEDARIGRDRQGNGSFIVNYFEEHGRSAEVVPFLYMDGRRVSSAWVRELVTSGNVEGAARLLGRNYRLDGRVVHGEARGRKMGVPTANLEVRGEVVPGNGVYATRVISGNRSYGSVTNIGTRPTFGGTTVSVEAHLFDYAGPELYGRRVDIEFVKRLREEKQFLNAEALVQQIENDVSEARRILGESS